MTAAAIRATLPLHAHEADLSPRNPLERPVPEGPLAVEILGREVSAIEFLYGGFIVSNGLREILAAVGRPLSGMRRILDLGCGSGRVLRWFEGEADLFGSDVSAGAIEWCREHLPIGRFEVNGPAPPLAWESDFFDLVIGVSVVTHLDEELQLAWLAELRRVLRPGGILALSHHGDDIAIWRLPPPELERLRESGHLYHRVAAGGLHGLPDFYQDAYQTRDYVERVWTRGFRHLAEIKYGPLYLQDLTVLEKLDRADAGGVPHPAPLFLDLAVCSLGAPKVAQEVPRGPMEIFGTAFHPRGGKETVDVYLDERRLATLHPGEASEKLVEAYPQWPAAATSLFAARIDPGELEPGAHLLRICPRTNLVASLSTYFFQAPR